MRKDPFKPTSVDVEKKINLKEGIIPFILTSKTVDRDSEVILPDGGDIEEFKKNPVFLWAHDMWSPPIGKVLADSFTINTKTMRADTQFDLDDPFASLVFDKYVKKMLNAGSIRFRPKKDGVSEDPVLPNQSGVTYTKWFLLEFSAVPVPANPQALAQLKSALPQEGDLSDDRVKYWVDHVDEMTAKYLPENYDPKTYVDFGVLEQTEYGFKEMKDELFKQITNGLESKIISAVDKALNPLLREEFQFDPEDYKSIAKAMLNLFNDKVMPDYQKHAVYDSLAPLYKKFDKKAPEFGKQPKPEQSESEVVPEEEVTYIPDNESVDKIIEMVKNNFKK